jgi:hypothetical protein
MPIDYTQYLSASGIGGSPGGGPDATATQTAATSGSPPSLQSVAAQFPWLPPGAQDAIANHGQKPEDVIALASQHGIGPFPEGPNNQFAWSKLPPGAQDNFANHGGDADYIKNLILKNQTLGSAKAALLPIRDLMMSGSNALVHTGTSAISNALEIPRTVASVASVAGGMGTGMGPEAAKGISEAAGSAADYIDKLKQAWGIPGIQQHIDNVVDYLFHPADPSDPEFAKLAGKVGSVIGLVGGAYLQGRAVGGPALRKVDLPALSEDIGRLAARYEDQAAQVVAQASPNSAAIQHARDMLQRSTQLRNADDIISGGMSNTEQGNRLVRLGDRPQANQDMINQINAGEGSGLRASITRILKSTIGGMKWGSYGAARAGGTQLVREVAQGTAAAPRLSAADALSQAVASYDRSPPAMSQDLRDLIAASQQVSALRRSAAILPATNLLQQYLTPSRPSQPQGQASP